MKRLVGIRREEVDDVQVSLPLPRPYEDATLEIAQCLLHLSTLKRCLRIRGESTGCSVGFTGNGTPLSEGGPIPSHFHVFSLRMTPMLSTRGYGSLGFKQSHSRMNWQLAMYTLHLFLLPTLVELHTRSIDTSTSKSQETHQVYTKSRVSHQLLL